MQTTRIFNENFMAYRQGKRRALNEGGTASSKTWSILFLLIMIAETEKVLISVVSESLPHLKRGCIRDFTNIMGDKFDPNRYNKTEQVYRFDRGTIEFFGADESDKVRGPRRDILFLNEANNIPFETARGLDKRTSRFTFADWNPVSEFWAHEHWIGEPENVYIHSTYLDAKAVIPAEVVANIESEKDKDPNWWNVYGLGLIGKIEGLVYPYFKQVDELPKGDNFYGLDFGYSSDPTVFVRNVIVGGNLYSQQMFYKYLPMTNDDIAREMDLLHVPVHDPIYPDPDEPKSAEELRRHGFNVQDTEKGAGSVKYGIKKVNSYNQFWTKDSLDFIKEQRNYRYLWKREPHTGREYLSDETTHQYSHCFIAGTLIQTLRGKVPIERVTCNDYVLTRRGWRRVLASRMTSPYDNVQTVHFSNGESLTGTPDHLIYTKQKGFIPLNTLRYGDIGVVSHFKRTNTDHHNAVPVFVLNVSERHKDKQQVFDLTISNIPEFYANGILVHNSMDARRYAVATYKPVVAGTAPVWQY
jgi:phage terminase large subunit